MKKIDCCIITDILPLYIDDVVSAETKTLVEEHLADCENCRGEFERLSQNAVVADNIRVRLQDASPLHSLRKRIRRKMALALSVLAVLLLILTLPFPVRVSRALDGIRWEDGGGQEACTVTVDGWYYRYLFRNNIFKGNITFTTTDGAVSYSVPNAALGREAMYADRGGPLTVYDAGQNRMHSLGYLAVSGNFRKLFLYSGEWSLSAPAGNLGEAQELAEELTNMVWIHF